MESFDGPPCALTAMPGNTTMHNLLVSFEIRDWQHQGALIVAAIEELGPVTRIFGSTWYVCSRLAADEAALLIRDLLQSDDGLMVADVANNMAVMLNVDDRSVDRMQRHWQRNELRIEGGSPPGQLIAVSQPTVDQLTQVPRTAA
jgi:hypothetical protein